MTLRNGVLRQGLETLHELFEAAVGSEIIENGIDSYQHKSRVPALISFVEVFKRSVLIFKAGVNDRQV